MGYPGYKYSELLLKVGHPASWNDNGIPRIQVLGIVVIGGTCILE